MAETLEISLQLELTDPISGELRLRNGPEQHFDGWLELNATLEHLHRTAREAESQGGGEGSPTVEEAEA